MNNSRMSSGLRAGIAIGILQAIANSETQSDSEETVPTQPDKDDTYRNLYNGKSLYRPSIDELAPRSQSKEVQDWNDAVEKRKRDKQERKITKEKAWPRPRRHP